jgi:nitrite reductase/ring-hydroxylating ferredoxin subunit
LTEEPDSRVLLVRDQDGRLHATATGCPHLGQPLTLGQVDGAILECGVHAFRYRLDDGVCVGPDSSLAGRLAIHEVREVDGRIEVRLSAPVEDP